MAPESLTPAIAGLLASAGLAQTGLESQPLPAGGNNRVYRVKTGDSVFAVKHYFHGGAGERDRLTSEFAFLQHAWRQGIRCVPRPLVADGASHLALYEFVDGRRPEAAEIDEASVLAAARFFAALNAASSRESAALPDASDACFSVAEHLASVDRRLATLGGIEARDATDRQAQGLVAEMAEIWRDARTGIERGTRSADGAQRCLSPSDFGFHNALIRRDGGALCFLDFEYAGWDDPAKMAGDFFWHTGMRPRRELFARFAAEALAPFAEKSSVVERVRLLGQVFRMRWCCIALNEFVADSARRRRFAAPAENAESRKRAQLEKARALLTEPDLL